jgi:hypothetical protein
MGVVLEYREGAGWEKASFDRRDSTRYIDEDGNVTDRVCYFYNKWEFSLPKVLKKYIRNNCTKSFVIRMMKNADAEERGKITEIILSGSFGLGPEILNGNRSIRRSTLSRDNLTKLRQLFISQSLKSRQEWIERDGRKKKLADVRDWSLNEFIDYYCLIGGMCPILGKRIPLKYLSVDR